MIVFSELIVKGFCGIISEVTLQLNQPGINIIRGRNGIGKSTFLSAFYWAIYGVTLKENVSQVNTWGDLVDDGYEGTIVRLKYFIDETKYEIIRCQNYKAKVEGSKGGNRLIYKVDGKVITEKSKPLTQKLIEKDLGISQKLMRNSVVFGQKLKRLIKETGSDKKGILEEAFRMDYIKDSRDEAIPYLKNIEKEVQQYESKISSLKIKKDSIKYVIDEINDHNKNASKDNQRKIRKLTDDILELKAKITSENGNGNDKEVSKIIKSINKKQEELSILTDEFNESKKVSDSLKTTQGIIKSLSDIKKRLLKNKDINSVIKNIESLIKALEFTSKFSDERSKIKNELDKLRNKLSNLKIQKTKIEGYKNQKTRLEKQVEELSNSKVNKKSTDGKKEELAAIKKEIKANKVKLKPLFKQMNNFEWLINDALGNKGIKNYIFEYYLNKLNHVLKELSEQIGFTIKLSINLESKLQNIDTTVHYNGDWRKYEELSGGQQQIVDVAIAIGMYLITSENINVNLFWVDELFESLDKDNISMVTDLLGSIDVESMFVITHNEFVVGTRVIDINSIINKPRENGKRKEKRKQRRKGSSKLV